MRPEKVWMVENLKNIAQTKAALVFTDVSGVAAITLGRLRSQLKEASAAYIVVKKRILKLAIKQTVDVEVDSDSLMTTGIAYGDDPINLAKILRDFSAQNQTLKIKSGLLKNRVLDKSAIIEMAKIPPRHVLLGQLVGILKRPMSDIVYVLKSQISGLAIVLAKIRDQKQAAEEKKN